MAAEALVESIINQALEIGATKSAEAASYSNQAMTAAAGFASFTPPSVSFSPNRSTIEPPVNIPMNASGLDTALYGATYDKIVLDLSGRFADFFKTYFPVEFDSLVAAQKWLYDTITHGGTGIKPEVEDQIWQRDRARLLVESARASEEITATFAARGFPLPPGAMLHQHHMLQADLLAKTAQASRDVAIKQAEIEIENVKFAVQMALDYRVKGIQAAGDYIKVLALGPEIAAKLATSSADAQARLITAASSYYNARIRIEEMKLDTLKFNAGVKADAGMNDVREFSQRLKARTDAAVAAAQAAGTQAAAALNAVHASAQVAVQGETA